MKKKNRYFAMIVLIMMLLLIAAGLLAGEWALIKNNSNLICFGCIGIG
jgi:hypothetical protein